MKYRGQQLEEILRTQGPAVTFTDGDGRPHCNMSPRFVADLIEVGDWCGYGKHGVIERVRPAGLSCEQFASKPEIRRTMKSFPRLPVVQKNSQSGRTTWAAQPVNARAGSFGIQRTLHFGT